MPGKLRTEVDARLDEVFRRCYARRDRRYASASEALLDLRALVAPARRAR